MHPKPVRNESFPGSIPEVLSEMSEKSRKSFFFFWLGAAWVKSRAERPKSRKRLDLDTAMADMAARDCLKRHRHERGFGLEHPEGSIARHLPSWKQL